MKDLFEIVTERLKDKDGQQGICIVIKVKIGGHETIFPISSVCSSFDALETEASYIRENIEDILRKAKDIFEGSSHQAALDLKPDMEPEDIWEILSDVDDEKAFIDGFNGLNEVKRREVADHVLTRCNIFSGKGSVFSARYDYESGLLK